MASAFPPSIRTMPAIEDRRADRDEVSFSATLASPQGILRVQVVNLSLLGFMVRCDDIVVAPAPLTLLLPELGGCAATAVWCLGGRIGGVFATPIAPGPYQQMLRSARLLRPTWPAG